MHINLSTVCFMAAMFAGFLYAGRGEAGDVAVMFAGICLLIAVCGRSLPGRRRSLVFHRDGRTTAPRGFAHCKRRCREVTGDNAAFISIEARRGAPFL
jgi:hypothetical protein